MYQIYVTNKTIIFKSNNDYADEVKNKKAYY